MTFIAAFTVVDVTSATDKIAKLLNQPKTAGIDKSSPELHHEQLPPTDTTSLKSNHEPSLSRKEQTLAGVASPGVPKTHPHTDPSVSENIPPPPEFPAGVVSSTSVLGNAISLDKAHHRISIGTTKESVTVRKLKKKENKVKQKTKKPRNPSSLTTRLFFSRQGEDVCIKSIFSVCCGLLGGGLLFVLLAFSFKHSYDRAAWITLAFTIILILGLVSSAYFRCVILMALPNLFTSRGHALLMALIIAIIVAGPVINISHNHTAVSTGLACITEIAKNASEELKNQLLEPLRQIYLQIQETVEKLKRALAVIEAAIQPVLEVLTELQDKFEIPIKALQNITVVS